MHRLPKHRLIRVFEGFAGYGGAAFSLKRAKINHKIVGYSEIDPDAIELYHYNFPDVPNFGDITLINPNSPDFPDFDLFTGGFPCQPFSTVGKRQGIMDERGRGTLFGDIIRICEVKHPKYILLENVKGLLTGRMKATFNVIIGELNRIGYDTRFSVLNSKAQLYTLLYKGFCIITDFSILLRIKRQKRAIKLVARFCRRKFVLITKF